MKGQLDVFDDFAIEYNHTFNDYKTISGRKTPYTDSFKLPLNDRNRRLLGIPFDLSFPKGIEIEGYIADDDGNEVIKCIYDITEVSTHTLEKYIQVNVIDILSYGINKLSNTYFYELMNKEGSTFRLTDSWIYNTPNNLKYPETAPFVLPYYNFNNRKEIYANDPMRDINQLQPTWVVSDLIKMIFKHIGIDIQSKFLFEENGVSNGINGNDLGLMLPVRFFNSSNSLVSGYANPNSYQYDAINPIADLMPVPYPTSPSYYIDILNQVSNSDGMKFVKSIGLNWNEMASTVDGKVKVTIENNSSSIGKSRFEIGAMYSTSTTNYYEVVGCVTTATEFDVYMVMANFEEGEYFNTPIPFSSSIEYDLSTGIKVGTAEYIGIIDKGTVANQLQFDITFKDNVSGEFEIEANQRLQFALVMVAKDDEVPFFNMTLKEVGGTYTFSTGLYIKQEYININSIDAYNVADSVVSDFEGAIDDIKISIEFIEPTELQTLTNLDYNNGEDRVDSLISLYDSYYNNETKVKLIDIVKMIMDRFNLSLFTRPNGEVFIDNDINRSVGSLNIDTLIDESVNIKYEHNDNGILTITDDNPSFYEDGFNSITEYVVRNNSKEIVTLAMKSCIVNDKMFTDVYNGDSYDVLKIFNSSLYWGISDRKQEEVKELKPTFCLIEAGSNSDIYFARTVHSVDETWSPETNGFFNVFEKASNGQKLGCTAVNIKDCYGLLSFVDNKILNMITSYNEHWLNKVNALMNNNVTTISVNLFVKSELFNSFLKYPEIEFLGGRWAMNSFSKYDLSSSDGSIVEASLTQIFDEVSSIRCLTPIMVSIDRFINSADTCGADVSYKELYHNGYATYPIIGNTIYTDRRDLSKVYDGNDLWSIVSGMGKSINVTSLGVVAGIVECAPEVFDSISMTIDGSLTTTSRCEEAPSFTTRYFDGGGTVPTIGDKIYLDEDGLSIFDGSGLWYLFNTTSLIKVESSGIVTGKDICSGTGTTIQSVKIERTGYFSSTDSCFNDDGIYRTIYFRSNSIEPTTNDILYTDANCTILFNGLDLWFRSEYDTTYKVDSVGLITLISTCI